MITLIDHDRLEHRFRTALVHDSQREGVQPQRPINVLDALATYLRDAASGDPKKTKRPIPAYNKRWMLSFGDDCDEVLSRLGFSRSADGQVITLPQVPPQGEPDRDGTRAVLLDAREELLSLISERFTDKEKEGLRFVEIADLQTQWKAGVLINLVLGVSPYQRDLAGKGFEDSEDCYAALGALQDLPDDFILYGFARQTICDPEHSPYYFDCFAAVTNDRRSESLELQLATMQSQGYYGRAEIGKAYRYFNIDPDNAAEMSDEHILGIFQSRLDSEPRHRDVELRQQLRIIGQARGSAMLQDSASNCESLPSSYKCYLFSAVHDTSLVLYAAGHIDTLIWPWHSQPHLRRCLQRNPSSQTTRRHYRRISNIYVQNQTRVPRAYQMPILRFYGTSTSSLSLLNYLPRARKLAVPMPLRHRTISERHP